MTEVSLLEAIGSYGPIGGAFIIMIWWNIKREGRLLDTLDKLTDRQAKMIEQQGEMVGKLKMLSEDQRDIRRALNLKKEEK